MATNQFFRSSYKSTARDQKLHEALIIESIQIHGIDCLYLPRDYVNFDKLFGEDQSSKFDSAYAVEFYLKNVDGFGGDDKFLSKFGLEVRDEVTLVVARRRFIEEITANEQQVVRPREGDLVQLPPEIDQRERLFEISYVSNDEIFYQLGTLQVWELRCTVFSQAGEEFETGIESVDAYGEDYYINKQFVFETGAGDFVVGEKVFVEETGATAEVVAWDPLLKKLILTKMVGEFDEGHLRSVESETCYDILPGTHRIAEEYNSTSNQDNNFINDNKINIIDFSEINPFSE